MPCVVERMCDCGISQKVRKWFEQGFDWIKTIGKRRKPPVVCLAIELDWVTWAFAAFNLMIRLGAIGELLELSPTGGAPGNRRSYRN